MSTDCSSQKYYAFQSKIAVKIKQISIFHIHFLTIPGVVFTNSIPSLLLVSIILFVIVPLLVPTTIRMAIWIISPAVATTATITTIASSVSAAVSFTLVIVAVSLKAADIFITSCTVIIISVVIVIAVVIIPVSSGCFLLVNFASNTATTASLSECGMFS